MSKQSDIRNYIKIVFPYGNLCERYCLIEEDRNKSGDDGFAFRRAFLQKIV